MKPGWITNWGVTCKQPDEKYHVVNDDGEVMEKTDTADEAYTYISMTEEAWEMDE